MLFAPRQYPPTLHKPPAFSLHEAEPGEPSMPAEASPWWMICKVGGPIWLAVTCITLLWVVPMSGTADNGRYIATTGAYALQYALVFMASAVAYRVAIALGWPREPLARLRIVLVNTLLALGVMVWALLCLAWASGFVDGQVAEMRDALRSMPQSLCSLSFWAGPLRSYLPPYALALCAIALAMLTHRHHRAALRGAELARAFAAARMAMLSAQLQPHFLFNSLHAIMGLIDENPRQASAMLARLGDFLRHALEAGQSSWVDVATELAGLETYLAIQQTRFADRLNVTVDVSPQALDMYVPSLLLQPLAENAIEHGRNDGGPTLRVRVLVAVVDERLCIAIHNSCPRLSADLSPADYGRGLENVSLRLGAAYGGDARLVIGPDAQGGTTAILNLPARRSLAEGTLHA
jgi:two-component system, LytTR family, sensor kinase